MLSTLKETIVLCSCLRKQCAGYYRQPIAAVSKLHVCRGMCRCTTLCLSQFAVRECRFLCMCGVILCAGQHVTWTNLYAWTSRWCLRFLPLCPDAVPHACSFLALSRSLSIFQSLGFWVKAQQNGEEVQPQFSTKGYQLRAAAAVQACCTDKQWKHQCSITSGAGLQRDPVTFDRFKTPAPPLIRFPEPPTFLCFLPCSCSRFYFVLFIGFSLKRVIWSHIGGTQSFC